MEQSPPHPLHESSFWILSNESSFSTGGQALLFSLAAMMNKVSAPGAESMPRGGSWTCSRFGVRPGPESCHCCQLLDLEQVTHPVGASAALRRAQSGEGPCSEPCLWRPSAGQAGHSVLLCFHSSSYITALSMFQNKVILFTFISSFQV